MTSMGFWDEIIDEAEAEQFVGREQELETFRVQINLARPRYLIFYITGQGGVGKTSLLNRYKEIAQDYGFLLTDCDEQQKDVPSVLGRFAHQLADQGISLKHFEERYKTYRQKIHEIESDPEAPQGLAAILGRTFVRTAFIGGDVVPGLRRGLEYIPREAVETQASEWATYLTKKLINKDEVALIREPIPILTSLFFEDLNEIAKKQRVLLCLDNFEVTRQELQDWLLRLREYKLSQNIRFVFAGRDQPGTKWDPLRGVTMTIRLDVFTINEAERFLDASGIMNVKRRKEIIEWSGRLPVLMSWLAAPDGNEPDLALPTHDIVDRFLRWITEIAWKEVALLAAIPQSFNTDILEFLLKQHAQPVDEKKAFDWLQTMPFVQQNSNGWYYHIVVRRMILRYLRQKSPDNYRLVHTTLAKFYKTHCHNLSPSGEEQWTNEQWRKYMLSFANHHLIADPHKHWGEIISLFAIAIRKHRDFASKVIGLLSTEDVSDELSIEQNTLVELFQQQLQAMKGGKLQDGFGMFDRLCSITVLTSPAKSCAFAYRGQCHRQREKWEKALDDFKSALDYAPKDDWIIGHRAETFRQMGRYQEALDDFNQAILIDNKDAWDIIH